MIIRCRGLDPMPRVAVGHRSVMPPNASSATRRASGRQDHPERRPCPGHADQLDPTTVGLACGGQPADLGAVHSGDEQSATRLLADFRTGSAEPGGEPSGGVLGTRTRTARGPAGPYELLGGRVGDQRPRLSPVATRSRPATGPALGPTVVDRRAGWELAGVEYVRPCLSASGWQRMSPSRGSKA